MWIFSDVPSALGGITIERTADANVDNPIAEGGPENFTYSPEDISNGKKIIRIAPELDGFRLTYENDTLDQNQFTIVITNHVNPVQLPTSQIISDLQSSDNSVSTRGVIYAPDNSENFQPVGRDGEGSAINVFQSSANPEVVRPYPSTGICSGRINVGPINPSQIPFPASNELVNLHNLKINVVSANKAVYLGKYGS